MGGPYTKNGVPRLDCVVTVVDALRMQSEFACGDQLLRKNIEEDDLENLVIQQIEFCNIVLLNKASEISRSELNRLKEIVKALQPQAQIIECDYGDVDLDMILNTKMFDFEKVATSATWIHEIETYHDDDEHETHEHEAHQHDNHEHETHEHEAHQHDNHEHEAHEHEAHHHHHHDHDGGEVEEYGIGTFVYYRRRPFNLGRFDEFVAHLPKSIIRAKGICYFKDEYDRCYLFEQAGKQLSLKDVGLWFATMTPEELEETMEREPGLRRDWDEDYGDRMQKLVFIGQHMDKEAITAALDACLTY
jgi:G3E family GTPase